MRVILSIVIFLTTTTCHAEFFQRWCGPALCSSHRMAHYPKGTKLFWNGCYRSCCQKKCYAEVPGLSYYRTVYSKSRNRRKRVCQHEPRQHVCTVGVPREPVCGKGFKFDQILKICVDVNECEDGNNGGCESNEFCENYYGGKLCFSDLLEERKFCQHDYRLDLDNGFECICFQGYEVSGFRCEKSEKHALRNLLIDLNTRCEGLNQVGLDGRCYSVSNVKSSYLEAKNECRDLGGELVNIDSRKTWWKIGHLVKSGKEGFYAVVSHDMGLEVIGEGQATVVNLRKDFDVIPQQLNRDAGNDKFYYVCEFDSL